jgi:NAD(P)-dependent dehydrogenase (short-subunit alcohol dehydrogenase family)
MSFEGKHYIITGGAGGIGLATARTLLARGAKVTLADLARPAVGLLPDDQGRVFFHDCDIRSMKEVEALVEAAVAHFGLPDGIVTSAGVDRHHSIFDLTDDEFGEILDINVLGSFRLAQACARRWRDAPRQAPQSYSVVLISSVNAVIATPTHTAYATSKGAIAQMTRVLAVELADFGVRVNAMAPGTVRTAMLDRLEAERPDALAKIIDRTPLGRVAEPEEIAGGIAYLLSDEASYVTGQTLFADGGRTIQNLAL